MPKRRVPQQERSLKRMARILDAAEALFAEHGYESTSTNAIAAEAEVSIGSIYQYFGNKKAIARAVADRYLERMAAVQEVALDPAVMDLPLEGMLNHMIDPFVAFHLDNPAFGHLMLEADVSAELAAATAAMDEAVIAQIDALIRRRVPAIPPERAALMAQTAKAIVKALFALLDSTEEAAQRAALIAEVKTVMVLYVEQAEREYGA